jgi:hypothetical protein
MPPQNRYALLNYIDCPIASSSGLRPGTPRGARVSPRREREASAAFIRPVDKTAGEACGNVPCSICIARAVG